MTRHGGAQPVVLPLAGNGAHWRRSPQPGQPRRAAGASFPQHREGSRSALRPGCGGCGIVPSCSLRRGQAAGVQRSCCKLAVESSAEVLTQAEMLRCPAPRCRGFSAGSNTSTTLKAGKAPVMLRRLISSHAGRQRVCMIVQRKNADQLRAHYNGVLDADRVHNAAVRIPMQTQKFTLLGKIS